MHQFGKAMIGVVSGVTVVAAVTMLAGWNWWQPLPLVVTLLSLLLTVLVILAVLALEPCLISWFAR